MTSHLQRCFVPSPIRKQHHVCFISPTCSDCAYLVIFPWSLSSYRRWIGFLVTWLLLCAVHPHRAFYFENWPDALCHPSVYHPAWLNLEAATISLSQKWSHMYPWREQHLYSSVTWWNHKHRLIWLLRLQTCTVESGSWQTRPTVYRQPMSEPSVSVCGPSVWGVSRTVGTSRRCQQLFDRLSW